MMPTVILLASGHVSRYKADARILQAEQKIRIAGQTIELRNQQPCAVQSAKAQSLGKLRAIVSLAALDFDDLLQELPFAAVEVAGHRCARWASRPKPLRP